MKNVSIRPLWTIHDSNGASLPPRLIELLVHVEKEGSLLLASKRMGLSYRHAWDLVRQGEAQLKLQLLHMERGRGSTLTELAARIVWADHRIAARLTPLLDTLASEIGAELRLALSAAPAALRMQASHGFAIELLIARLGAEGMQLSVSYAGSVAAVAALRDGHCDVAGLHVPLGPMQDATLQYYRSWLDGLKLTQIDIANRRQGLIVRAGNPKDIYTLADLTRKDVRFINRQPGSGTRLLLEGLLASAELSPADITGFEQGEHTHAAVAAYVASGMADVGFGLETPARRFKLDFVPVARERYFLLCRSEIMGTAAVQKMLDILRASDFRAVLATLPGYDPAACGDCTDVQAAFAHLNQDD